MTKIAPKLYKAIDIQELFSISRATLHNWQRAGVLKPLYVKGSRMKFYRATDIDSLIEKSFKRIQG